MNDFDVNNACSDALHRGWVTLTSVHNIAIAECIVQKRMFTMLAYSDGTPTYASKMHGWTVPDHRFDLTKKVTV